MVSAFSALAGGWLFVTGGGLAVSLLSACGGESKEELATLKAENKRLELELLRCKVEAAKDGTNPPGPRLKYGGVPDAPRAAGSASVKPPCDCEPGDPMCSCL